MAKTKKKRTPKRSKKTSYKGYAISILIIIVIIGAYYLVINGNFINGIAATVNGEVITSKELNQKYEALPDQYKIMITKNILLEQIINTNLLVQEAESKGIEVNDDEIQEELDILKADLFESDDEFQEFLRENDLKLDELNAQLHEQLIINKLLQQELLSKIEVSEEKIKSFYETNKELLGDLSYDEVKDQINQSILEDLSNNAIQVYVAQLRAKADIIMPGEESKLTEKKEEMQTEEELTEEITEEEIKNIITFDDTREQICTENDKPVIRFYTTSKCKLCSWANEAFYSAVEEYEEDIIVYHWELDTGDNLITEEVEDGIPKEEVEVFKKYNSKSTVPTYVFGCRYVRSGNGYEDIEKEKEEFMAVIGELVNG